MATRSAILKKLRRICLSLPDTMQDEKWGKPHFCVAKKIFAGCGEEDDRFVVGFKPTTTVIRKNSQVLLSNRQNQF